MHTNLVLRSRSRKEQHHFGGAVAREALAALAPNMIFNTYVDDYEKMVQSVTSL
jgi:hypothetical protein